MNKYVKIALVALLVVGGFVLFSLFGKKDTTGPNGLLGFDRGNSSSVLPFTPKEYNQVGLTASASSEGLVSKSPTRVFSIEVTSDATSLRYLQLFDVSIASVSRAASLSFPGSLVTYKASQSWAKQSNLNARPLGSYQKLASTSLVFSVPIPPATASSSPTVVRIDSSMFAPAKNFVNGLIFGISTLFNSYASPSAVSLPSARHKVKIIYE